MTPAPGAAAASGRLLLDVSTLVRWAGPAIGIPRVQHGLACWARAQRQDVTLVFYSQEEAAFVTLSDAWQETLLGWDARLADQAEPPASETPPEGEGKRRVLPRPLTHPRRTLYAWLEERRARLRSPLLLQGVQRLQDRVGTEKIRRRYRERPARASLVPDEAARGRPVVFGPSDSLLLSGLDWRYLDGARLARLKAESGCGLIQLCHDIIPLQFPQWFSAEGLAEFESYFQPLLSAADHLLFTTRRVAEDTAAYCAAAALPLAPWSLVPLAGKPPLPEAADGPLPGDLQPGRFALFVSSIEPRKNHALLLEVWRRLSEAGLPQRAGFRLVFVGRYGWCAEGLADRLMSAEVRGSGVVWLQDVDDALLARLYRAAAFCLYPSFYEGYGLPVVEAFGYGKAVIASSRGAVPEVAAGLAPCLDPEDPEAWQDLMARWIAEPEARAPVEAAIRAGYRPVTPEAAAEAFFAAAQAAHRARLAALRLHAAQ